MTEDQTHFYDKPSKSQRKRDMLVLQKLGEQMVKLPLAQLELIPLDDYLKEAIKTAHTLKSHEAIRRQLQYIGRLMRSVDIEPIKLALDKIFSKDAFSKAQFHKIERWRDKLITLDENNITEFLTCFPDADQHYLRELIHQAKKKENSSQLFRYLRQIIEKSS